MVQHAFVIKVSLSSITHFVKDVTSLVARTWQCDLSASEISFKVSVHTLSWPEAVEDTIGLVVLKREILMSIGASHRVSA
jgi:hypothetical protein